MIYRCVIIFVYCFGITDVKQPMELCKGNFHKAKSFSAKKTCIRNNYGLVFNQAVIQYFYFLKSKKY